MSFIHDIIKRQFVYEGYLPNYPYHLISDKEMFNAFINLDSDDIDADGGKWFGVNYPVDLIIQSEELFSAYYNLRKYIIDEITTYLDQETPTPLSDWIYSYMIGSTISVNSNKQDIHDLLVLLGADNLDDDFTITAASKCYAISKQWLSKLTDTDEDKRRPATMFGEPHIIKSLRLNPLY